MRRFKPEGNLIAASRRNWTLDSLSRAQERGEVLEAFVTRCDADHTLWMDLGEIKGCIPRQEAVLGLQDGTAKEIAVLSRVGRPVCFRVIDIRETVDGPIVECSRRLAQQEALDYMKGTLRPGDIIQATVSGLAKFGAFCDIGRGITALLPSAYISVARTRDANERFYLGQEIHAAVKSVEKDRFVLSHRELLGSWRDNAALFAESQAVPGTVRGVMPFGIFVELTPNLCGLCEYRDDLKFGDRVSVWIKSIQAETQKIKLAVISKLPPEKTDPEYHYFRRTGHLDFWQYAPAIGGKEPILTCF